MANTTVNGLEQLNSIVEKYLKIKDEFLDNNYIDAIGDISKFLKFFKSMNEIRIKRKVLSFIEGFNLENNPTEEEIDKLILYVNNEKKAEFISDTLSKILFAKSRKACMIIGAMIGYLKDNLNELPVEYIICISGLTDLFDHDIEVLKYIYKWVNNEIDGQKKKNASWFYITKEFKELAKVNNVEISSLVMTIEKLVNSQYLLKRYNIDFDPIFDIDFPSADTSEGYKLTEVGTLLCRYIAKLNI